MNEVMNARVTALVFSIALALAPGCAGRTLDKLTCDEPSCAFSTDEWKRIAALSPLPASPADRTNRYRDLPAAVALGRSFFFDARFSGPASQVNALGQPSPPARAPLGAPTGVSCATCHDLAHAGIDATSVPGNVSQGAGWTDVNALSIVDNVYNRLWFRNGRADSAWAVSVAVAESATTMNGNRLQTAWVIADTYRDAYDSIFGPDGYPLPLPGRSSELAAMLDSSGHCLTPNGICPAGCRPLGPVGCWPRFPLHGKRGRTAGCQADSPDEPFGDAWDCMDAADQAAVTRVLVNWAKALDAFQATQVSGDTPFDRFVREGVVSTAISSAAKRGARLFVGKAACIDCHSGPLLSDRDFHNVGVPQVGPAVPRIEDCPAGAACDCVAGVNCLPFGAWDGLGKLANNGFLRNSEFSDDRADTSRTDELTRADARSSAPTDLLKGAWRTPSLRNVAATAPYMHDGLYATLAEVVAHYARGGSATDGVGTRAVDIRPLGLTPDEQNDLVAFLLTLTTDKPAGGPPPPTDAGARDAVDSAAAIDAVSPPVDPLGPLVGIPLATFDTTTQGFFFDLYNQPANLAVNHGPVAPALTWDANEGAPARGALRVTVPFSDYFQTIFVVRSTTPAVDWTGRVLRARIKVASGFNPDPAFPSGAQIYIQTTSSYFFDGAYFNLAPTDDWQEIAFALDSADEPGFDASQVVAYGVQLTSGDGGQSSPGGGAIGDAGVASAPPTPAVVFLDSFTLE
jgi:cytochrome c peroxidase